MFFKYVKREELTAMQRSKIIRSSMFLKETFDALTRFQKLKSRLVAGGDGQARFVDIETFSPTVCLESVMMVVAIASAEKRDIDVDDVTAAFLECKITDEVLADEFVANPYDPCVFNKRAHDRTDYGVFLRG